MLLVVLGLIDIIAGISMIFPNFLAFYLGLAVLMKGVSSMFGIATENLWIAVMGIVDIIAGASLVLGFSVPLLWMVMITKGFFSLITSLAR